MAAMIRRALAAFLAVLPVAASAQPAPNTIRASYAGYATGFNVVNMDVDYVIASREYRVHLAYHTAGALSLLLHGEQDTRVEGRFVGDRAAPVRFFSAGHLRGRQRVTQIDYAGGNPVVRQLQPPNEEEREPVPEAQQAGTIDTISAMAQLLYHVNATGRCDGRATTFDGRRLATLTARTAVQETLEPTRRSSYSGPALRCDFEGQQLAGFRTDLSPEEARRPRRGSAWFARLQPEGPLVPVRLTFEAPFAGNTTMYLTASSPQ